MASPNTSPSLDHLLTPLGALELGPLPLFYGRKFVLFRGMSLDFPMLLLALGIVSPVHRGLVFPFPPRLLVFLLPRSKVYLLELQES